MNNNIGPYIRFLYLIRITHPLSAGFRVKIVVVLTIDMMPCKHCFKVQCNSMGNRLLVNIILQKKIIISKEALNRVMQQLPDLGGLHICSV